MSLTQAEKLQIIKEYGQNEKDTGSCEVQIALLTQNILKLTPHFQQHKHDHHSRRGLLRSVDQRRKLLTYLKKVSIERYRNIVKRLNLRG